MRNWWRVWVVFGVVLALGIGRLLIEWRPGTQIDLLTAWQIADKCLGPAKTIAVNTTVALEPLPEREVAQAQGSAAQLKKFETILIFRAASAIQVDLGPNGKVPDKLSLTKDDKTSFEFDLESGPLIVKVGDEQFYFDSRRKPRFGPSGKNSYSIKLDKNPDTKIENGRTFALVPVGATGTMPIGTGVELIALQPVPTKSWLHGFKSTLLPVRAIGQQGLNDLAIDVKQGGIRFDEQGFVLEGCGWRSVSDPGQSIPIGVAEVKAAGVGAAVARLTIPSTLIPAWPDDLTRPFSRISLVLASLDGRYKAYGGFTAVPKLPAALVALLLIGAGLMWLMRLRGAEYETSMSAMATQLSSQNRDAEAQRAKDTGDKAWFASLFLGSDHQPSLSLFQIFFWTVITVWGITYVYLVTGNLLAMTASMMGLLGIAGTGSVIARWISPDPKPDSAADPNVPAKPFDFWQILSTNGNFDLLKLQLLVFTLMIGMYVVWRLADTAAFPELDVNTLLLLGVSQGLYIGGKIAGTSAVSRAQALKADLALKREARKNLDDKIKADTTAASGLSGDPKAALDALIAVNKTKLEELDKAIAVVQADYDKVMKELGLQQ